MFWKPLSLLLGVVAIACAALQATPASAATNLKGSLVQHPDCTAGCPIDEQTGSKFVLTSTNRTGFNGTLTKVILKNLSNGGVLLDASNWTFTFGLSDDQGATCQTYTSPAFNIIAGKAVVKLSGEELTPVLPENPGVHHELCTHFLVRDASASDVLVSGYELGEDSDPPVTTTSTTTSTSTTSTTVPGPTCADLGLVDGFCAHVGWFLSLPPDAPIFPKELSCGRTFFFDCVLECELDPDYFVFFPCSPCCLPPFAP